MNQGDYDKALAALPEIMTVQEVADFLRVSKPTVYRAIDEGRLPSVRIGATMRGVRVFKAAFIAWMKGEKVRS